MEIKSFTEQEKRALAVISIGIYGKELTLIMLPELKEYLNGSTKSECLCRDDPARSGKALSGMAPWFFSADRTGIFPV